ncbi:hypothetical protein [Desulfurivibrio dismutans]|uniref:hypothetical protein n=1 Tax=Desulfurivibrio dismutans TaxID=1398908 RepID=UPI0023DC1530|nr:hypothetical protein [Desulfurivibrio alkaliphilus]MDF1613656.1 hypothetical protein [Desulfurivibrio alkaliphilus]
MKRRIEALEKLNQPPPPPLSFLFTVEPAKGPIKITLPGGKFRTIQPGEVLKP